MTRGGGKSGSSGDKKDATDGPVSLVLILAPRPCVPSPDRSLARPRPQRLAEGYCSSRGPAAGNYPLPVPPPHHCSSIDTSDSLTNVPDLLGPFDLSATANSRLSLASAPASSVSLFWPGDEKNPAAKAVVPAQFGSGPRRGHPAHGCVQKFRVRAGPVFLSGFCLWVHERIICSCCTSCRSKTGRLTKIQQSTPKKVHAASLAQDPPVGLSEPSRRPSFQLLPPPREAPRDAIAHKALLSTLYPSSGCLLSCLMSWVT